MRDIKFRGWDELDNDMVYQDGLSASEILDRFDCIMQYTGLKDKEGKEIYEDDIVKGLVMVQNDLIEVRGLIKFIHGRFVIVEHNCSLYKFSNALGNGSNEITKIGNKHENPELLKK